MNILNNKSIVILSGTFYDGVLDYFNINKLKPIFILFESELSEVKKYYYNNYDSKLIFTLKKQENLNAFLENLNPDIIISLGWKKILNSDFFFRFRTKTLINIHPATLPNYKGYHTEPYIIINNEKTHGITAHLLTPNLDAGDIILQQTFSINEYDTVNSLKRKINTHMPLFIQQLFTYLDKNDKIQGIKQKGHTKIRAPKRTPNDSEINPEETLKDLYHIIRATEPDKYPAFFKREDGVKVFIKLWTNRQNKFNDEL